MSILMRMRRRNTLIGGAYNYVTNLVASWQFENDFLDYTGNHPATATGTVTNNTPGKVGNEADFKGTSDYLTVTNNADFSFTDGVNDLPFSIAFWVKFDAQAIAAALISKRNSANKREWQLFNTSGTGIFVFDVMNPTTSLMRITVNSPFTNSIWYHVVATYDGSKTKEGMTLYIDTVSVGARSEIGTYTGMVADIEDVTIGAGSYSPSITSLNGSMDEVKVYKNRVLTADEILNMYNLENAGTSVLP